MMVSINLSCGLSLSLSPCTVMLSIVAWALVLIYLSHVHTTAASFLWGMCLWVWHSLPIFCVPVVLVFLAYTLNPSQHSHLRLTQEVSLCLSHCPVLSPRTTVGLTEMSCYYRWQWSVLTTNDNYNQTLCWWHRRNESTWFSSFYAPKSHV